MNGFTSLSVMMGTVTETYSLIQTVEQIAFHCDKNDIAEVLITYPEEKITPGCRQALETVRNTDYGIKVIIFPQKTPFIGFYSDTIEAATGSHCIPFSSDMPMDIAILPKLIERAKKEPDAIISTSRFLPGCRTPGYPPVMMLINRAAQLFLRVLYGGGLTDYTNPTQIVPTQLYKDIRWEYHDFARFLELTLKPLRLGCRFAELPVDLCQRTDGTSAKGYDQIFSYLKAALRIRFMKKENILKKTHI